MHQPVRTQVALTHPPTDFVSAELPPLHPNVIPGFRAFYRQYSLRPSFSGVATNDAREE